MKVKVAVFVEGGVVTSIWSNNQEVDVDIFDFDSIEELDDVAREKAIDDANDIQASLFEVY